jgi:hypothetical protein
VANAYVKVVVNVSEDASISSVFTTDLRQKIAESLGIDVALVISPESMPSSSRRLLDTYVTLHIAAISIDDALNLRNLAEALQPINITGTMVYYVSADAFLINRGVQPHFDISTPSIVLVNNDHLEASPFNMSEFLVNISAPPDAPLDRNGTEQVVFSVTAVAFRPFSYGDWTAISGSDPGLLATLPLLLPSCDPKCTNATLFLTQLPNVNGQVRYEVALAGSNVVRTFTVTSVFAFTPLSQVDALEDQLMPEYPGFVNISFIGVPRSQTSIPIDWSFTFSQSSQGSLFAVAPVVDSIGDLSFVLAVDAVGMVNYLFDATNGVYTSKSYPVLFNVSAINDPPSFTISNLVVNEDQYSFTEFSSTAYISTISMGPADEAWQSANFTASYVSGDDLLVSNPIITADYSTGSWTAEIRFKTKPYRNGLATYKVRVLL